MLAVGDRADGGAVDRLMKLEPVRNLEEILWGRT
jgi:hypothetical protein